MRDKEVNNLDYPTQREATLIREDQKSTGILSQSAASFTESEKINCETLIKNAKILLAAGDFALAKNIFKSLVERGDMLGVAYSGLGTCLSLENKDELAIRAFREAIIYEPTYGSLYALAELYIKKSEFPNAVGTLLRASNLPKLSKERTLEIHKALGGCYMHMNQLNNAEAHFRNAYEIQPNSDSLHVSIGSLAIKRGDMSTSLLHYKEAARLNPKNTAAFSGIGLAHLGLGQKDLAFDAFVNSLKLEPKSSTALFHLIKCAYDLKRYEPACSILKDYMKSHPVNSNILFSYAGLLFHQGLLKESLEEVEKLTQLNPYHEGAGKLKKLIQSKLNL